MILLVPKALSQQKFSLALLFVVMVSFSNVTAQDTSDSAPEEASPEAEADVTEANKENYLVINELGFGVGYPTYQLYHLHYAFQREEFGVVFRGSYTASDGLFLSIAGRYYTPLPVPVPTFVSLGAGVADGNVLVSGTFGAHVPFGLGSPWRATLEGGLAYVGGQGLRPVISLGVGYVFFVDTAPVSREERERQELARQANCQEDQITEPDIMTVEAAFDQAVEDWLDRARAQYAGTYSNLSYRVRKQDPVLNGNEATIEARASGSVTERATGAERSATATITARFGWTGCSWRLLGYTTD
jgi:hypothetical protein